MLALVAIVVFLLVLGVLLYVTLVASEAEEQDAFEEARRRNLETKKKRFWKK